MNRSKCAPNEGAKPEGDVPEEVVPEATGPEEGEGSTPSGADFLQLDPAQAPRGGRADWLAERLRAAIGDGRLPVGARLPPTRVLAADLRLSRGVVTAAYQRLVEDGHVAGRGRAGTVVVAAPPTTGAAAPAPAPPPEAAQPADPFAGEPDGAVFERLRGAPARIDLTPGVPDLAAFPRAAWLRAERAVLARLSAADLGYGDPRGAPALRAAVVRWLARNRGVRADPGEVIVVSGVAQALGLVAQVLGEEGVRRVGVEDPGSLGVRQHLARAGMAVAPLPVDAEGVSATALAESGVGAAVLTPAHQFPTGVVLSAARRGALARWARGGGIVVEDDYDAEHRYGRPPAPALRSVLPESTCYTGSVSKLLAPALRLGWLLVPPRLHAAAVAAKRFADLGSAVLPQLVLAHLMDSGDLERHLRTVRRRHRRRRDAMVAALAAHLPDAAVHGAAAGLHLLVTLPPGAADTALASACLERGVKVQPLSWHTQRPQPPGLVLGYGARTATEITEGVAAVGAALRALRPRRGGRDNGQG
ncbi:PLP-dependent aminotransferase family protein [Streptomonospora sp. S1-112]|uniref:PLP-dependent aminotransferase family protein n=1 Tax=Streptomonospora mangrovi TaxID=2883123 RepID=A0A9X3SD22_9ACTN|nr:PLP-dependent aminotransferase family protein [Streptomonospora mangrovi]MDA0563382.1 PLP-dependent aminotransferase family protein [Streptomonospora mangrovi]